MNQQSEVSMDGGALSLDDKLKRGIALRRGEEVVDGLIELGRVVGDEVAVADSFVHLEGLDYVAHQLLGLLRLGNWTLRVVGTEEETEWSRVDQGQVEQIRFLLAERSPVAVRVPLESVLLCILRIVVEGLHRNLVEDGSPATRYDPRDALSANDSSQLFYVLVPVWAGNVVDIHRINGIDSGHVEDSVHAGFSDRAWGQLGDLVDAVLVEIFVVESQGCEDLSCAH